MIVENMSTKWILGVSFAMMTLMGCGNTATPSETMAQAINGEVVTPANILIYGGIFSSTDTAAVALKAELEALGHTVTSTVTALPQDLTPYNTIWVPRRVVLTLTEITQLTEFAQFGGGLYLTGENPSLNTSNLRLAQIVNNLVPGSGVRLGERSVPGLFGQEFYAVHQNAVELLLRSRSTVQARATRTATR